MYKYHTSQAKRDLKQFPFSNSQKSLLIWIIQNHARKNMQKKKYSSGSPRRTVVQIAISKDVQI